MAVREGGSAEQGAGLEQALAAGLLVGEPGPLLGDDLLGGALDEVRDVCFFEKIDFAATASPAWPVAIGDRIIDRWLVTGMETHVCVFQTVRALRDDRGTVHVVADACASRTKANFKHGLALAAATGAVVTNTETVVFDLLGRAGTDDFRALSKLLK